MGNYHDLFNLTVKENFFLLKKHLSGVVYSGLKMENRNITFPQTEVILSGVNSDRVSLDDVNAVVGLKKAFEIALNNLDKPLTIDLIKHFNLYIAKAEAIESGVIRSGSVSISGTDYVPGDVTEREAQNEINSYIKGGASNTEKALNLFVKMIYRQYFWDGNKRTALLAANFFLCQNGCGVLEIKEKDMLSFTELLNKMFNSGSSDEFKDFLYTHCIVGMTVNK